MDVMQCRILMELSGRYVHYLLVDNLPVQRAVDWTTQEYDANGSSFEV